MAVTITAPAAAEALDTEAETSTANVKSPVSVSWTPADATAGYDKAYTATFTLSAVDANKYGFTDGVTVTVNGEPAETGNITRNADGSLTVSYTFDKTGLEIGTCGTNVKYTIDGDTIRYSTYDSRYETHWNSYSCRVPLLTGNIKKVYIDDKMLVDTNLQEAFSGNTFLEELHLNNFVMNLPDLNSAFSGCSSLKVVEISDLGNTSGLRSLYHTFAGCTSLEELDLSGWDTSNVEDMAYMFSGCSNLKNLKLHDKWVTSGLNNRLSSMFSGCTSLTDSSLANLYLSFWNTSNVKYMDRLFEGCSQLTNLSDISNWNTANVQAFSAMFAGCSGLQGLNLNSWNTASAQMLDLMFSGCTGLQGLDLNSWNTSNVTMTRHMFDGCTSLSALNVKSWNTSNVTTMTEMFRNCSALKELDISGWSTSNMGAYGDAFKDSGIRTLTLGKNSFGTSIYDSVSSPYYPEGKWIYIAQGADAADPLPIGTVRKASTFLNNNGYDYTKMAGTWTVDFYTITLNNVDEGKLGDDSYTYDSSAKTYVKGYIDKTLPVTLPETPAKDGWTFAGWTGTGVSEASKTVTIPAGSTGNREYTAEWVKNPTASLKDLELEYGYTDGNTLTVTVDVPEGYTLTYKWYQAISADTIEGSTLIPEAASGSYAIPVGKPTGTKEYYYCVVTASSPGYAQTAEAVSNIATVTIVPKDINPAVVTLSPAEIDYDEQSHTVSLAGVVLDGEALGEADYEIDPEKSTLSGTDEDTYIVTVKGKGNYTGSASGTWKIIKRSYTITWMNQDGTETLETDTNVLYGTPYSFEKNDPTKDADAQYTYTFAGWAESANAESGTKEESLGTVKGDKTFYAAFSKTVNKYKVTWMSQDGSQALETDTDVEYGTPFSYYNADPTKDQDAQYSYVFEGWADTPDQESGTKEENLGTVKGNKVFYAAFSKAPRKYTVTWMSQDGSQTLETDTNVEAGSSFSYNGTEPTKAATGIYTYSFAGWSELINQESGTAASELGTVRGNTVLYAAFSKTVNKYTVYWMNHDGTQTLETDTDIPYGTAVSFGGTEPAKEADAHYTYSFAGWAESANAEIGIPEADLPAVKGNMTFYAAFSRKVNKYTITWMSQDGTETLEIDNNVAYGSPFSFDGSEPTKPSDGQNTYVFTGWAESPNQEIGKSEAQLGTVEGNKTLYAAFSHSGNLYKVTWMSQDGTQTLETDNNVAYGSSFSYGGPEPTKEATAQYTYTFAGWAYSADQESGTAAADLGTVKGNTVLYAAFSKTVNKYSVNWLDGDGSVLKTYTDVEYGSPFSYDGPEPTKAATAQYTYTFAGWAAEPDQESGLEPSELGTVKGETYFYPAFSKKVNKYTITWMSHDGTQTLETDNNVAYGSRFIFDGSEPTKPSDGQHTYIFTGWAESPNQESGKTEAQLGTVESDKTLYAAFSYSGNLYTVTWMSQDGTQTLEIDKDVVYGSLFSYDGPEPTKEATDQYTYTFAGWAYSADQESGTAAADLGTVKENTVLYAAFSKTVNKYSVTWLNWDGTELEKDETVEYGETPAYNGETPVKELDDGLKWTFIGWTPEVTAVSGDAVYTAEFTSETITSTVTILTSEHGSASASSESGVPGAIITLMVDSIESGYEFKEWKVISGNVTVSGNTFKIGTENVEIMPVFEEIKEPMDMNIEIFNYQPGMNFVPYGVEDLEMEFSIQILMEDEVISEAGKITMKVNGGDKKITLENVTFNRKIDDLTANYDIVLKDLPESVTVGTGKDAVVYHLSYDAWIRDDGMIVVYLKWDSGSSGSHEEEIKAVPLPEDEIGAYKLLDDGTKEYLIFQTYDICMWYLNNEEECSGHERCFHKEGYYGVDWWPVVIGE